MSKKVASLLTIIFTGIVMLMSFLPMTITTAYWKADIPGRGIYTHRWESVSSLLSSNVFLTLLMLSLAAIAIVAYILIMINKKNGLTKIGTFAPLAVLLFTVLAIVCSLGRTPNGEPAGTATSGYYGFYEDKMAYGAYLMILFALAAAALSVLFILGKVKEPAPAANAMPDPADELAKFKALLDSGAITQEEFEAKKQQLLGL